MEELEETIVEPELNPSSIEEWLSFIEQGKKGEKGIRRCDLAMKVKKHLSALGWIFYRKRELHYKSPNGKVYYSLATACKSLVDEESKQIVPKSNLACSVSNQTKKKRKLSVVLSTNESTKKRRKMIHTESPIEEPRKIVKSLTKILQVMEKKNEKEEKESLRFWRKDCGSEMNCDVCCVCHYGGELLLCDGCPSAFHHSCLSLSNLPEEDLWFCPCCCCNLCGKIESKRNSKLMNCEQCQRRFHLNCLEAEEEGDTSLVSCQGWFCSRQCNRVYTALESLLGCEITVGGEDEDLVWRLIRAPNDNEHYDKNQIFKLDSAINILHQGFEPSKDPFSGKDLVEELVFRKDGSHGTGKGRGFYTVLIERKNQPVTAAAIRVDKDVVEIPLVATLTKHRRSGMCRVLMNELEKQMSKIGVCRLVLPAAKEVVTTWTQRFGFSVMKSPERLELVKHGMLDFVGTVMCHKFLVPSEEASGESSLTE